jgi:cell wall-associated NlpC family hydrolase
MKRRTLLGVLSAGTIVAAAGTGAAVYGHEKDSATPARMVVPEPSVVGKTIAAAYKVTRAEHPARTVVTDKSSGRRVATFTDGARTVSVTGKSRTFTEKKATATVSTDVWIRLSDKRWKSAYAKDPAWMTWLRKQIASDAPDILQFFTEYLRGAPAKTDSKGRIYAGDAGFGIERGASTDGADFHEYMGVPWDFDGVEVPANPQWAGHLDCSGYLRMVYGFRGGLPLLRGRVDGIVDGLPRTAEQMAYQAKSALVAAGKSTAKAPTSLNAIQPGDLVFFAMRDDPNLVSHSGVYLGVDPEGDPRFASSRGISGGPSFGDFGTAKATLNDPIFAADLRRVIRL